MVGTYWSFIAVKNKTGVNWQLVPRIDRSKASSMIASYRNNGYRLKQIETLEGTNYAFLVVKEAGNVSQATVNLPKSHHQHLFNTLNAKGYRLVQGGCKSAPAPGNEVADDERYALYEKDGYATWSKHSLARLNARSLFDYKATQGYYLADLDVYNGQKESYYVSGMAKPAVNAVSGRGAFGMVFKKGKYGSKGAFKTDMSAQAMIAKHNQLAPEGYFMAMCVGYDNGSSQSPVYTALWRKPSRVRPTKPADGHDTFIPPHNIPDGPGGLKPNPKDNDLDAIPDRPRKPQRNPRIPTGPGGFKPNPRRNGLDAIPTRPVDPKRNPRIPNGPNRFGPTTRPGDQGAYPRPNVIPQRNPRIPTGPNGYTPRRNTQTAPKPRSSSSTAKKTAPVSRPPVRRYKKPVK